MELLSTWGLAIVDQLDGARRIGCWPLLVDSPAMEADRGSSLRSLAAALGDHFFAESGNGVEARTRAAALARIAADSGQREAMSALSHALGETALLDGSADQAAGHFAKALSLLPSGDSPFDRAESERRAAAALIVLGRREEAVEHLVAAHRTARRGWAPGRRSNG